MTFIFPTHLSRQIGHPNVAGRGNPDLRHFELLLVPAESVVIPAQFQVTHYVQVAHKFILKNQLWIDNHMHKIFYIDICHNIPIGNAGW